jgi:hypothetical protein
MVRSPNTSIELEQSIVVRGADRAECPSKRRLEDQPADHRQTRLRCGKDTAISSDLATFVSCSQRDLLLSYENKRQRPP